MARVNRSKASKKSVTVDFKGVESRVTVPEGDYAVKVAEASMEEGDKGQYIKWVFDITDGKQEGNQLYYNTSLTKQSLWNLKNLLMVLGVEVPSGELDIELEELVDLEMMAVVAHEKYEGKPQSKIVDFYATDEDDAKDKKKKGKDDEDEKESKSSKRGKDKDDEKEEKSSKRRGRDKDEDEEKEDKKSSSKKDKKAKDLDPLTEAEVEDMDEDELETCVKDYDLDVDLDDIKSKRKKISAVIDALESKDLIKEEKKTRR